MMLSQPISDKTSVGAHFVNWTDKGLLSNRAVGRTRWNEFM